MTRGKIGYPPAFRAPRLKNGGVPLRAIRKWQRCAMRGVKIDEIVVA